MAFERNLRHLTDFIASELFPEVCVGFENCGGAGLSRYDGATILESECCGFGGRV